MRETMGCTGREEARRLYLSRRVGCCPFCLLCHTRDSPNGSYKKPPESAWAAMEVQSKEGWNVHLNQVPRLAHIYIKKRREQLLCPTPSYSLHLARGLINSENCALSRKTPTSSSRSMVNPPQHVLPHVQIGKSKVFPNTTAMSV
ncbi:hypothetical protein PTI98_012774 [Pleurotus ostreatus]|nr:hypothetical protein PTI98_012774 [Pleurotus ostreatus]